MCTCVCVCVWEMKSLVGCTLVDFTAILLNTPFQPGTSLATYKIKLNEITANNNKKKKQRKRVCCNLLLSLWAQSGRKMIKMKTIWRHAQLFIFVNLFGIFQIRRSIFENGTFFWCDTETAVRGLCGCMLLVVRRKQKVCSISSQGFSVFCSFR